MNVFKRNGKSANSRNNTKLSVLLLAASATSIYTVAMISAASPAYAGEVPFTPSVPSSWTAAASQQKAAPEDATGAPSSEARKHPDSKKGHRDLRARNRVGKSKHKAIEEAEAAPGKVAPGKAAPGKAAPGKTSPAGPSAGEGAPSQVNDAAAGQRAAADTLATKLPQIDPGSPLGARRQAEAAQKSAQAGATAATGNTKASDTAANRVDTSRWVASAGRKCGNASWYGSGGSHTASGERFAAGGLTAAHRSLPFGTRLLVTDMETNRSLLVRVNDRGPFTRSRVIDLSRGAARELGFVGRGVIPVCMAIVG